MSYISSNRLRFHYDNILRQDLLLKLNYGNIMQVPRICEIYISSSCSSGVESIKNVSLALELVSGQKFQQRTIVTDKNHYKHRLSSSTTRRLMDLNRNNKTTRSVNDTKAQRVGSTRNARSSINLGPMRSAYLETSLRSPDLIYNFLEKFLTIIAFFEYNVQYQLNIIQITLGTPIRLFPEIQNHFVFFENFQNIQVKVVTSSLTEKETRLLWSGLNQKEI